MVFENRSGHSLGDVILLNLWAIFIAVTKKEKGMNKALKIITTMLLLSNCCYSGNNIETGGEEDVLSLQALPELTLYNIVYFLDQRSVLNLRESCKKIQEIINEAPDLFRPKIYIDWGKRFEAVAQKFNNPRLRYIITLRNLLLTPGEEAEYQKAFPNAEYQIELFSFYDSLVSEVLGSFLSMNFRTIHIDNYINLVNQLLFPQTADHKNNFLLNALAGRHLRELTLSDNNITDKDAVAIANALPANSNLRLLSVYQISLYQNSLGAETISNVLTKCSHLEHLNLTGNNIGAEGAKAISNALTQNNSLTHLNLRCSNIGAEGAKAISNALTQNNSLTYLDLGGNNIGAEGAETISNALTQNNSLTYLDLGGNNIGAEGAKYISDPLKTNRTLTSLMLGWNYLGLVGAKYISDALAVNSSLNYLFLDASDIGTQGINAMSAMHRRRTTPITIKIRRFDSQPIILGQRYRICTTVRSCSIANACTIL